MVRYYGDSRDVVETQIPSTSSAASLTDLPVLKNVNDEIDDLVAQQRQRQRQTGFLYEWNLIQKRFACELKSCGYAIGAGLVGAWGMYSLRIVPTRRHLIYWTVGFSFGGAVCAYFPCERTDFNARIRRSGIRGPIDEEDA